MNNANRLLRFSAVVLSTAILAGAARADDPAVFGPNRRSVYRGLTGESGDRAFGVHGGAGNVDYRVVDMTHHSPMSAAVRSLLVPGWGQGFNRQRVKGALLFATFAFATYGAIDQYRASEDTYDEYEARGLPNDDLYEQYETEKLRALVLGGAAAALWAFAVIDAYRNAYNPLWSKRDGIQVVASAEGGKVVWKKSFGQP